ncbi:MAG: SCP2 sterol-binding domain-containing protein [Acidimicrobiales bacterium]
MNEFAAATTRATEHLRDDPRLADVDLVIEQCVRDNGAEVERYHVCVGGRAVRVVEGASAKPDITICQDMETARALQRGELHAQGAYLTGRLTIEGNVQKLLQHAPLLHLLVATPDA